jgi:hypothetical protein
MNARASLIAALVVALVGALPAALSAQKQIQVYASIVDASGQPVAALAPEDIRLMENDQEAKVTKVEAVSWTTKVQLLVDNGVGLGQGNLNQLREGMRGTINALPEGVELTIVTTSPQPRQVVRATTDRAAQLKGLDLLAPDTGAGRFLEALNEAMQRFDRDKGDFVPTIIALATSAGDRNILERDIERLMKSLDKRPATVHVVLLNSLGTSGGANQTNIGEMVAKSTRGRFEVINAPTRLTTLLPELGAQVAKSMERQSKQFRITADRPGGASGDIGPIKMGSRTGSVTGLSFDGRQP